MSLFTYYCSCEQLWLSIFKYVTYLLVLFFGILIGKKHQEFKKKNIKVKRERLKDILNFSLESPSPRNNLYPTNIFAIDNNYKEFIEVVD